jgi:CHAT domain
MVVIQPHIPNGTSLPFTKEELQCIEKHVKSEFLVRLGIKNVPATVQEVVPHLSSCHVVHFACHGKQNANNPLESGLILHNGIRLTVKEIMKQSIPNASLAFLSACKTAMGAENLPDEAMHLAASLLFAGFRGVVATMWSASYCLLYISLVPYTSQNTTGQSKMKTAPKLLMAFMNTCSRKRIWTRPMLLGHSTMLFQSCARTSNVLSNVGCHSFIWACELFQNLLQYMNSDILYLQIVYLIFFVIHLMHLMETRYR